MEKARETKFMESNKIDGTCPSMMKVTYIEHEGTVNVKFWENHYGHNHEIGRIRIDEETRTKIAAKLKEGVTFAHIIDSICDQEVTNDTFK
ncbi:hypothetical protein QTP88_023371 [Uroleucon formosanum]